MEEMKWNVVASGRRGNHALTALVGAAQGGLAAFASCEGAATASHPKQRLVRKEKHEKGRCRSRSPASSASEQNSHPRLWTTPRVSVGSHWAWHFDVSLGATPSFDLSGRLTGSVGGELPALLFVRCSVSARPKCRPTV